MVSLPTRLTDTTATLIDNIWTNNVRAKMESGLVTVRVSDHLPIFVFVGGERQGGVAECQDGWRRVMDEGRIQRFADRLGRWEFDEARALGAEANVARFRNEFRDMYDAAFPWVKDRKRRKDEGKPWLDDVDFKELVREKGELYTGKLRGTLEAAGVRRLVEVSREVNSTRRRLKRAYFDQRLAEIRGDMKATWGVLGELLRGKRGRRGGGRLVGILRKMGQG